MPVNSGTSLVLKIHTTSTTVLIAGLKTNGVNLTQDFREVTSKDSGDYKEFLPTRKDVAIPFDGLLIAAPGNIGIEDILGYLHAGTLVYWEQGDAVTGSLKVTGTGYIADLKMDAPDGDNATYSGSIKNTGAITVAAY